MIELDARVSVGQLVSQTARAIETSRGARFHGLMDEYGKEFARSILSGRGPNDKYWDARPGSLIIY